MTEYELVAGVETHVQLGTRTKLFCGCPTTFGAPPNSQTCPVCLGHPGSLPVLNRSAFELALRAALALHCEVAPKTKFDRKHYFYPDLPKNYQISQYDLPFSREGHLELPSGRRIRIQRVHLEEDAGKLIHEPDGNRSLVDLNRAGLPLIEIVTHPDFRSADEVHEYLTRLKDILIDVGCSRCDMEKGELRCDLNISLRPKGSTEFGARTEVKNLNSFRFAREALLYEFDRQQKVLREGGRIVLETRLYDSEKKVTRSMRSKEEAHDYRYFPEPDLPPVTVSPEWLDEIRKSLPSLRANREAEYVAQGLAPTSAKAIVASKELTAAYEALLPETTPATAASTVLNLVARARKEFPEATINPISLLEIIRLKEKKIITNSQTEWEVYAACLQRTASPENIAREMGLFQGMADSELADLAKKVCGENKKIVADYRGGKTSALQALIGRMMKETKGRANPKLAEEALKKALG